MLICVYTSCSLQLLKDSAQLAKYADSSLKKMSPQRAGLSVVRMMSCTCYVHAVCTVAHVHMCVHVWMCVHMCVHVYVCYMCGVCVGVVSAHENTVG